MKRLGKKIINVVLVFLIIASTSMPQLTSAERVTIDINDLSSWDTVTSTPNDSPSDAGGGGYELVQYYIANDADYFYYRWDIQLSGNNVVDLVSTNLGIAMAETANGTTADLMVWITFSSKGVIAYSLERLKTPAFSLALDPTDVKVFNEGQEDALVSVVTRIAFSEFSATGIDFGSIITNTSNATLWTQTNASSQVTAVAKDRIPDGDAYLDYNPVTGAAVIIGGSYSSAKEIITYSVPGQLETPTINSAAGTISVQVPAGTDLTALAATFTTSPDIDAIKVDGVVQVTGVTTNDFSNTITYTVVAEDLSVKTWVVTITEVDVIDPTPGSAGALDANTPSPTTIDLNWTTGSDNISDTGDLSYQIYYSTSNNLDSVTNAETYGTAFGGLQTDISSDTVTGLTHDTQYFFTVVVSDEAGNKAVYNTDSETTLMDTTAPVTDSSLEATSSTSNPASKVDVTWAQATDAVSDQNALEYHVYYSINANDLTTVAGATILGTSFGDWQTYPSSGVTVDGLSDNTTYYFTVLVRDEAGKTAIYNTDSATTTALSNDKEITAFDVPGQVGDEVINDTNGTIALIVTHDTDITDLISTFTASDDAVVDISDVVQNSGTTANDFTSSVTYTVTAEDGSTKDYIVTITKEDPPSSEKAITAFDVPGQVGDEVINDINGTIALTVTHDTDITDLISTFTASDDAVVDISDVVQSSGTTANDFTSSVTYTVTAEDGSTKDWEVTITVLSDTTDPTPGNGGTLDASNPSPTTVDLDWTVGTDDTTAQAGLTYQVYYSTSDNMATVSDASTNGTAFGDWQTDINSDTVTGLSNNTEYYFTVVVKDEAGNESIYDSDSASTTIPPDTTDPTPGNGGTLDASNPSPTTVDLGWTVGTDDTTAQAGLTYQVYYSTSDNMTTVSDASNNGTAFGGWQTDINSDTVTGLSNNTEYYFTVVVKDEAGNESVYNSVSATTTSLSSGKDITSFDVPGQIGDELIISNIGDGSGTIALTVSHDTDVTDLIAAFTVSDDADVKIGSDVQVSGTTENNFTSTVTYTVTAEDGSTKDFVVTISKEAPPSTDAAITAFTVPDQVGPTIIEQVTGTIGLTVPHDTDLTDLIASFTASADATVDVSDVVQTSGTSENDFTTTVTYTVTAEDGTTEKDYIVTIIKLPTPSSDKEITSFSLPNQVGSSVIEPITGTIALVMPAGTDLTDLISSFETSAGVTSVKIGTVEQSAGTSTNDFSTTVTYLVTAEDESTKEWTVTVIVNDDLTPPSFGSFLGVTAQNPTPATVDLTWPEATDNVTAQGDLEYRVYYAETADLAAITTLPAIEIIEQATSSEYTFGDWTANIDQAAVNGLDASTEYYFTVAVRDEAGNMYLYLPDNETTLAPYSTGNDLLTFEVPGQVGATTINNGDATVSLQVAPGTDVSALIADFTISPDATAEVSSVTQVSGTSSNNFTSVVTYTVIAEDSSEKEWTVTITEDTTAPLANGTLTADNPTYTTVDVNWPKANDNTSAQGDLAYQVYYSLSDNMTTVQDAKDNGGAFGTWQTDISSETVTGLNDGTNYYFTVVVQDEAGNESVYNSDLARTLLTPDTENPYPGILSAGSPGLTSVKLDWTAAYDNRTTEENISYQIYYSLYDNLDTVDNAELNGSAFATPQRDVYSDYVTGISNNTRYYFTIVAVDEAGNKTIYNTATARTRRPAPEPIEDDGPYHKIVGEPSPVEPDVETPSILEDFLGGGLEFTPIVTPGDLLEGIEINNEAEYRIPEIPAGEYVFMIGIETPDGDKLTGVPARLIVDENNDSQMITLFQEAHSTVIDIMTQLPISAATVQLYWADTANNVSQGRVPNTAVALPTLTNYLPNANSNPQNTDLGGLYGFLTYANSDYYIIVEKEGYELYDSRLETEDQNLYGDAYLADGIIHVGETFMKYDIEMLPVGVTRVVHPQYIMGYENSSARIKNNLTGAELAAILTRLMPVQDINDGNTVYLHWYSSALEVTRGTIGESIYQNPLGYISRSNFLHVLADAFSVDVQPYESNFTDIVNHKNRDVISTFEYLNFVYGYFDHTFQPDRFITREEAIAVINRTLGRSADPTAVPKGWIDVSYYHSDLIEASYTHTAYLLPDGSEIWLNKE